jgi:hypothetical protein
MAVKFNILHAMNSPDLWAGWFKRPETWQPWKVFLSVLFGLQLTDEDFALYRECTGRGTRNAAGYTEAWLICGRRAGKSFILALIACYLAVFKDWRPYLAPGEVGTIKIIATDKKQARVIHRYCRALLTKVSAFSELIDRDTDEEIVLNNSITIEIQSASFRTVRGFTLIAALCDEISYWRSDDNFANPDAEILNALRPAMATVPGSFFLAASSPYSRRGELWKAYRQYYANDNSRALCWVAPTRTMNPTVSQRIIDDALEEDPARGAAEYMAEFRSDIETFVQREVVEAAVIPERYELPCIYGPRYYGFVDPSGAAADAMTLAISHREPDGSGVVDCLRERRPPFSPEQVVAEFSDVLKAYKITRITGERWGGEWVAEAFRKHGIVYQVSDKVKSAIYLEFLPLLNSDKVELLDHKRMVSELCGLERRTGRGSGKETVDHPPGAHDDLINSVAGSIVAAFNAEARRLIITDEMLAKARLYRAPQFRQNAVLF